ncbi:MAG: T9SS type A sorting domain-containing protein [Saprospiraceae bacterium]
MEQNVPFCDYFAHDDGSAELQFFWQQAQGGEETAVQYKTNVEDSLRGIQIMFPHFTFFEIESQLFNLKVWLGDANGPFEGVDPVYEMELVKPFFVDDRYDTLQAFTTYKLEDLFAVPTPLYLPADQYFYVGYEQLAATSLGIPIGYDLNNPCNCNFGKRLNTWINFNNTTSPKGALMIRPVFGNVVNSSNPTVESSNSIQQLKVYPNPAIDQLNIHLENGRYDDYKYLILNQVGQLVQQGNLQSALSLSQLVDGAYYLQTVSKKTGEISIQKFIIAKN